MMRRLQRRSFLDLAALSALPLFGCSSLKRIAGPNRDSDPVIESYFLTAAHKFVWRNWDLVSAEGIAGALQCEPAVVEELAAEMGLAREHNRAVPASRMWFQLLRRNWDFVPFGQISHLLGESEQRVRERMRPLNFVGNHLGPQPHCQPILVESTTSRTRPREELNAFRDVSDLSSAMRVERRFAFLAQERQTGNVSPSGNRVDKRFSPRIIFPFTGTVDALNDEDVDARYSPEAMAAIADQGADAIWVMSMLRELVPSPFVSNDDELRATRMSRLRTIVDNASQHGIGVYLVLNEPRGMPEEFFQEFPHLRGAMGRPTDLLESVCTSTPEVRSFLEEGTSSLFAGVPELKGLILITASEAPTHCYSIRWWTPCPRCGRRKRPEVVGEVIRLIERGARRAKPTAEIIAWDWSWSVIEPDPQSLIIDQLPRSVALLVDFERGARVERAGSSSIVDEYSLSVVGPSSRALSHIRQARARQMEVLAKIQVGNSWELGLLPYIPVPHLIGRKIKALVLAGINGAMMSWTLGTFPSQNWHVAMALCDKPDRNLDEVLEESAASLYGQQSVGLVRDAWSVFSNSLELYPFSNRLVYSSVVQLGPVHPLYIYPTGRTPRVMKPSDDLAWTRPFGPEAVARAFSEMAEIWETGLSRLDEALQAVPRECALSALKDFNICRAVHIYFKSIANQIRLLSMLNKPLTAERHDMMRELIAMEVRNSVAFLPIVTSDSRIGFEPYLQYFYTPQDVRERIVAGRVLLRTIANNDAHKADVS